MLLIGYDKVLAMPGSVDPLDIAVQISELRRLKEGWLDGAGLAPASRDLDWLTVAFAEHYSEGLPQPHLYPTPEGGVRAEWSIGDWELSLNIESADRTGFWHALDLGTDECDSRVLDLREVSEWNWLAAELRRRSGVGT